MPLFSYKAIDASGKNVLGRVEAVNLFDLEQRLGRMGLDLVNGAPTGRRAGLVRGLRIPRQDLINFCFHLEQLASAGVPVMEGLADLRESIEKPRFREVVSGLVEAIEGGRNLSQALGEFPEVFSKVFVSLIRAGDLLVQRRNRGVVRAARAPVGLLRPSVRGLCASRHHRAPARPAAGRDLPCPRRCR